MYDYDFGLVSEGPTDHAVLMNILHGYCRSKQSLRDPRVLLLHPTQELKLGGWTRTLNYLKAKNFIVPFQSVQFIVVHIDADRLQDDERIKSHFRPDGTIDVVALVAAVHVLFKECIGEVDYSQYGDRFVFAVAVRDIECWLLPLWDEQSADKLVGCTQKLNNVLTRKGEKYEKSEAGYRKLSKEYSKKNALHETGIKNPSLKLFIDELDRRAIDLPNEE